MAVIAFIDQSPVVPSVIEHAVWAAKRLDQRLVLVTLDERVATNPSIAFDAYQGMHLREDMLREITAYDRECTPETDFEAPNRLQEVARLAKEMGAAGVRTNCASGSMADYIAESTDSDDLLVLGKRGDSDADLGSHLESVLHSKHRTMLLVPDRFREISSWLLAFDGRLSSGEAVRYLTRFPLLRDIAGKAVICGTDATARVHFGDAVSHMRDSGHTLNAHALEGSPDDILPAVLEVAEIDLLVMGAYGQGRLRSLIEGSTTTRLLRSFPGPVLVSRR